jgi:hypothetical protein
VQAEAQQNRKYVRVCKGACRGIVLSAWIPNHIHQGGGSTWALSSPGPTWVLEGDDSTKANCHHHRGFMIQGSRLPILLISVLRFSFDKRDDRQLHTDHTARNSHSYTHTEQGKKQIHTQLARCIKQRLARKVQKDKTRRVFLNLMNPTKHESGPSPLFPTLTII